MTIVLHGTNGITFPDGEVQAVAGAVTMYEWATNTIADTDASDNTITATEGIGTGITASLVAGDEIVIQLAEIFIESSDTSDSTMDIGIYDGTTFYSAMHDDGSAANNGYMMAPANGGDPDVIRQKGFTKGYTNTVETWNGEFIFGQRAFNLSTDSKTWKLAFRKESGNGCIILGSTNVARWSIGIRRETT